MNPAIANGLSFDVEEYFHALNLRPVAPPTRWDSMERRVAHTTREIARRLEAANVKATFFVLGWVGKRDPGLVRELHAAGHEIASHGMSHAMAGELGPEAFHAEAVESKAILEDAISAPIRGFRASTFSITESTRWALDALVAAGYRYDSSIFPVRHDRYGWPSFSRHPTRVITANGPIVELPMLTLRLLGANLPAAGGGYLRLLPLALLDTALARMNAEGYPGVLYLHPWEFDPGQPRLLESGLAAFRHYHGLDSTMGKLERLLARHRFGRVDAIADAVERGEIG